MTFDEQYPGQTEVQNREGLFIFRVEDRQPCNEDMGGCGTDTNWIDGSWGLDIFCCSEDCRQAMERECAAVLSRVSEPQSQ